MRRLLPILFVVFLAASIQAHSQPVQATSPAAESEKHGFRTLSGEEARAFRVPGDMRMVWRADFPRFGLTQTRYQQFVGNAEVLGGQITVWRDKAGEAVAVIGSHYPDLTPSLPRRFSATRDRLSLLHTT